MCFLQGFILAEEVCRYLTCNILDIKRIQHYAPRLSILDPDRKLRRWRIFSSISAQLHCSIETAVQLRLDLGLPCTCPMSYCIAVTSHIITPLVFSASSHDVTDRQKRISNRLYEKDGSYVVENNDLLSFRLNRHTIGAAEFVVTQNWDSITGHAHWTDAMFAIDCH